LRNALAPRERLVRHDFARRSDRTRNLDSREAFDLIAHLICRASRMTRSTALATAAALSAAYVMFLGWPAPAARAAALAVVVARCQTRQRHVQANALLAATCLVGLLVDPWAALGLGGWLSAAALWGASTFTRWSDGALGTSFWIRTAASSLGATLATAPITAGFLGTVALAGLLLNFPAIPLAALAVPGVLASLILLPIWPGAAEALAAGAGLGLHLLELCAVAGAALPAGHRMVEPGTAVAFQQQIGHSEEWLSQEGPTKGGRDLVVDRGWGLLAGDFPEKTTSARIEK
jgi:ComEC/Rec2-related protein